MFHPMIGRIGNDNELRARPRHLYIRKEEHANTDFPQDSLVLVNSGYIIHDFWIQYKQKKL